MKAYAWITIALLLVSSLVLIFHLSATGREFSRYNVGWNGTSDFFSSLDRHTTRDIQTPSDLAGYRTTTLIVISPDREITADDAAAYRDFVARGNTLLLADDFGSGDAFLRSLGSSIEIQPGNLSSVDRAYADAYMVVVYPVGKGGLVPQNSSLVLDQAATLTGGDPLLATTFFSWVDTKPDRKLSAGEVLGRYEVMAQETIGNGTLYVLSDPSIFINGMHDQDGSAGNAIFLHAIAHAPAPLLVDTYASRTARGEGLGEIIHSVRSNDEYKFVIAVLLMAAILVAWHRRVI